ncbi:quinohemoprotein amine dehydrogenase subunit beta [Pseudomonas sp. zbq_4]|uniref:quinohemoprotein amine dehydrogenase subunit beta n=1 Tax=Pseudomonas TaxID=286 RepID=UPI00370AEFBC
MKNNKISRAIVVPAFFVLGVVGAASAKDYIAAPIHPHNIAIIDTEKFSVDKILNIENSATSANTLAISPDGKFVYALANGSESVVKIDIQSGANVGRIDFSSYSESVKALWGMALSPDGKTIAVYQNPVKKLLTEYQVQPTRVAFYDSESLKLKFVAPAPRQIATLMYSTDGTKLYGMGREMYVFDAGNGKKIKDLPIQSWSKDRNFPPDLLNVWSQYETSNMVVAPYYLKLKNKPDNDPEVFQTGLYTLDLKTGNQKLVNVEPTRAIYFSATASPNHQRAYGVYNVLQSFDLTKSGKPLKQIPLPHTYYTVHVTSDNKSVWVGGGAGDFLVVNSETLEKIGEVRIPGGGHMSNNAVRMFTVKD